MSKIKKLNKKKQKDVKAGFCPYCNSKLTIKLRYRICFHCNKFYKLYENTKWKALSYSVVLTNKPIKVIGNKKYFVK